MPAFVFPEVFDKSCGPEQNSPVKATGPCSRREFLARIALGLGTWAGAPAVRVYPAGFTVGLPPIALFSKVYQELNLSFEDVAQLTADSGLDGIDCPVRPGGQVLPERAADDLPRLAQMLEARGSRLLLLTTAIQSTASPHAETILRTARRLGVRYYRLGYWHYPPGTPPAHRVNEIKAQLKDLAALNQELGICGVHQNHAGTTIVGAKVRDLYEIASAFSPDQIALAFDIGHALNELPGTWRSEFLHARSHIRVPYVKDWKRGEGFVPFGQGEIGTTDFFSLVRATASHAPVSMHIEYEWAGAESKTRPRLRAALQRDLAVLKNWWAAA